MTSVLTEVRRGENTEKRGRPSEDRGREWNEAAIAKECLEPPPPRRGREGFSPTAFGRNTALLTALILDSWPPELRENKCLLF